MRNIGIYGGTFDPPHFGHVIAVKQAKKLLGLDEVLVIPAARPPHKQTDGDTTPEQRLEMTTAAFKRVKYATVLPIELERGGASYTADTVAELRDTYQNAHFFLITGADMFMTLQNWYCADEIFAACTVVAMSREAEQAAMLKTQGAFLFERFGATYEVLENPVVPISSTELRELLRRGEDSKFLQPEVLEVIRRLNLYRA